MLTKKTKNTISGGLQAEKVRTYILRNITLPKLLKNGYPAALHNIEPDK
jgi:hypothetical protein